MELTRSASRSSFSLESGSSLSSKPSLARFFKGDTKSLICTLFAFHCVSAVFLMVALNAPLFHTSTPSLVVETPAQQIPAIAHQGRVLLGVDESESDRQQSWGGWFKKSAESGALAPAGRKMQSICILSADMYGAHGMGGTATALWLLANLVKKNVKPTPRVTWVGMPVPQQNINCTELEPLFSAHEIEVVCLEDPRSKFWSNNPFRRMGWAALQWLREQPAGRCDVVHGHEWGGFAKPILMAKSLGEFPDTHVMIAPHGGHMWARQAVVGPRETSFFAQETDADERFALENADSVVAPSQHMIDFLRQRGWRLDPPTTHVIGNVQFDTSIGPMEDQPAAAIVAPKELRYKPVKNVVYFGRLQARKGLNLFLEALSTLPQRNSPDFAAYFIGGDNSGQYADQVRTMAASWRCKVHLHIGLPRAEALELLNSLSTPGALVVLPSLVENQPFTVAEAALAELPMLSFDVGGVSEMLTPETMRETLVVPTAQALSRRMAELLTAGKACIPVLKDHVAHSWRTWIQLHHNVTIGGGAKSAPAALPPNTGFATPGRRLMGGVASSTPTPPGIQLYAQDTIARFDAAQFTDAVHLRRSVCSESLPAVTDTVAMVDPEFEPVSGRTLEDVLASMRQGLHGGRHRHGGFSAMSAGVHVSGSVAKKEVSPPLPGDFVEEEDVFPGGPYWMPRVGSGGVCMMSFPLVIRRDAFCMHFTAEARTFRKFKPWLLALLLEQGEHETSTIGTMHNPLFALTNTSSLLRTCSEDHNPIADEMSQGVALNLQHEALLPARIARVMKLPAASSSQDFSTYQGHKGWRYMAASGRTDQDLLTAPLTPLIFSTEHRGPHFQGAPYSDGTWTCPTEFGYPQIGPQWVHPCAGGNCCDGAQRTAPVLQYKSSLRIPTARLRVFVRYFGGCGDGVRVVLFAQKSGQERKTLQDWNLSPSGIKGLVKYRGTLDLDIDDTVEIRVLPNETMDCDGLEFRLDLSDPMSQAEYKSDAFLAR